MNKLKKRMHSSYFANYSPSLDGKKGSGNNLKNSDHNSKNYKINE